jgi:transketolase
MREAQAVTDRPSLISVKTVIGYGMPTQGTRKAHSDAPGADAVRETKRHLGWPEDEEFYVPEEALAQFRKSIERGERSSASGTRSSKSTRRSSPNSARRGARR